jgi:molybdopterin molybdotransferase
MLGAMVREAGGEPLPVRRCGDRRELVRDACSAALGADVVVTCGGASVGPHDFVPAVLEELGVTFLVRGVAMRPGRPVALGQRGHTHVCVLPGNPASAFVTFELFVRPLLRACLGAAPGRRTRTVVLAAPIGGAGSREHWARVSLDHGRAHPLATQVSGDLRSIAGASALVRVPAGTAELPAGTTVEAIELPERWA